MSLPTTTSPASAPRPVELGTAPSLLLDLIRLAAAIIVVIGHLSEKKFSTGWPDLDGYALNAVTAFFLLSGFVIRYVTVRRPSTLVHYLIDRGSRIYSVLLPALLLSAFVDVLLARGLQPIHLLTTTIANLTFTAESWHHDVTFVSNVAMWSLCFECFYYVLYGFFYYAKGWQRWLLLLLAAAAAGPEVLTLLPVWLAGCFLLEVFRYARQRSWFLPALSMTLALGGVLVAVVPSARAAMRASRSASINAAHQWNAYSSASRSPFACLLPHVGHGSRVSLNAYGWGAILFVTMLLGLLIASRIRASEDSRSARAIRLLAEATYPLYLIHRPLLFVVVAALRHPIQSNAGRFAVVLALVGLSVCLGVVCNRFKRQLRLRLLKLATKPQSLPAQDLSLPQVVPQVLDGFGRSPRGEKGRFYA